MFIIKDDPNICDFVADITAGDYDDKLDQLKAEFIEVIRRRQVALVADVKVGDRIEIGGNISPKYLKGVTATVTEIDPTNTKFIFVHLDLDHRNLQGKKYSAPHFNYGSGLGVPISCVSKLEA